MRSEAEMMDLVLGTARDDERIRAVVMNGSRANPNAPVDPFRDYDIVYFVEDVMPFVHDLDWIRRFGEMMILQLPDEMEDPPPDPREGYAYLMQFMDGNRIDLTIAPLSMIPGIVSDSETIALLDKDGRLPSLPPPSDRDYLPKPPTAKAFFDCCNEFWWLSAYVAKELWRRELPCAKAFMEGYFRPQLMKMLSWNAGMADGYSIAHGKHGKYLERALPADRWSDFLSTYAGPTYEDNWRALLAACSLFRRLAEEVAERFGFAYDEGQDSRVSAHLERVRRLPGDAKDIP